MLRIKFNRDDLARVRFVLSPLGETTLSAQALLRDDGASLLGEWRQQVRQRLTPAARPLLELVPPERHRLHGVAVATSDSDHPSLQEELERLETASPESLLSYLAPIASQDAVTSARLREVPPQAVPRLVGDVVRAYHAEGIAQDWPRLRWALETDLAYRARLLLRRGVEGALATLHPTIRWRCPWLQVNVPCYGDDEVELAGRGLVLVPSLFVWPYPLFLFDGAMGPLLVYPAHDPFAFFWGRDAPVGGSLAAVLGRTRAAMVEALGSNAGCSAEELSRRLDLTMPGVAKHLRVLRAAGLLATHRHGRTVFHTLTELGEQLLRGAGTPAA
jgi:DNA-binding transcriptional ArsR family regulator